MRLSNKRLITTKGLFTISIIVAVLTIMSIWLWGLGQKRTLFENSVLSTSVLSFAFFLFIVIGLYKGVKLKDDIGNVIFKFRVDKIGDVVGVDNISTDIPDLGDDIGGIIIGVLAWILFSFLIVILIWLFGAVFWISILAFIAMLYWIFFRALRLVFKNSRKCKDDIAKSVLFGFGYTVLYNFWIYGIILISHYLIK